MKKINKTLHKRITIKTLLNSYIHTKAKKEIYTYNNDKLLFHLENMILLCNDNLDIRYLK